MTGVTYADLIGRAEGHIAEAASPRWTDAFVDQRRASAVLATRADVLDAIGAHVWAIVAPARQAGYSHGNDATERTAVALANELRTLTPPDPIAERSQRRSAHPWAHAAREIRAASDLLAVHHDTTARPRSPEADTWRDTDARAATLARLGALADRVLATEDVLALRAGQAHLPWAEIRRLLPDTTTAQSLAGALAAASPSADGRFGSLRLIGETVRTDTPTHELTDRMTRVRHLTWELLKHPDYSTATLRDLATLATAVHAHTAAHHTSPRTGSRSVEILLARARSWQRTAHDLAEYLSPAPAHPEIHEHVRATTRVLAQVAPLAPASGRRTASTDREMLSAALRSAMAATEKVQDWAAQAFGRLADHADLYVPATTLAGDLVTDDPALAHAKLTASTIRAPKARTDQTIEHYRAALPTGSSLTPHIRRPAIGTAHDPMTIRHQSAGSRS